MADTKETAEMPEKLKALEAARLQIEKQFGAGSLIKLGSQPDAQGVEVIPSGSILLDEALGVGGYPRGRIIEMYGPESSGKTTLALHAIAEAQKLGFGHIIIPRLNLQGLDTRKFQIQLHPVRKVEEALRTLFG